MAGVHRVTVGEESRQDTAYPQAVSTSLTGTVIPGQLALVDATAGTANWTISMSAAKAGAGAVVGAKKVDTSANPVNVLPPAGDTINTAASQRQLVFAGEACELVSDGISKWVVRSSDTPASVLNGTYAQQFKPEAYGAKGDGTTDDSAAVIAAIAAAYAAGGGTIAFGAKTYRIDSQLVLPNDGHSTIARQPPLRFTGAGPIWDGSWQSQGVMPGGTVLDLRSTTGPAKIDTRGLGNLLIDNLTLTQAGSAADTNPFVQTTNTTIMARDVAVFGHSTLTGAACVQDAFVLGGTVASSGNLATSAFQGYGSTIERCYFGRIQRAVYGRVWSNSVNVLANTISASCGAGSSAAAIQFVGTTGFSWGAQIAHNLIELTGYVYGIRFTDSGRNQCVGNGFWDDSVNLLACYYLEGSNTNTTQNWLGGVFTGSGQVAKRVVDATPGGTSSYTLIANGEFFPYRLPGATTLVQPELATGSESSVLLAVKRSPNEGTNASQFIASVTQAGKLTMGGSWSTSAAFAATNSTATVTYDSTSVVKNTGNLDLYGGSGGTDVVRVRRGVLQVDTGIRHSTAGPTWTTGTGTPEGAVIAPIGSMFSRTDGGAGTCLYVKESGAGNTGWVAK